MRFVTTAYEFSHGRRPRGWGIWHFGLGQTAAYITPRATNYGQAKSEASAAARAIGYRGPITVGP